LTQYKVLAVTSQWPTPEHPEFVPFLVREIDALRSCGLDIDVFAFKGGVNLFNYVKAWWRLQVCLRSKKYDLVHVHFGQSGLLTLFSKKYPVIVTFRGSDLNGIYVNGKLTLYGMFLRRVSQLVSLHATEIILVSHNLSQFISRKNYTIIPSGIDLELFRPMSQEEARKLLGLSNNHTYILFVGNKTNLIKRYDLAVQAVKLVDKRYNAELLVVENENPSKIPIYMNAANTLLITSSREGSPNILKEALACNLPVVSVDVGDARERLSYIDGCHVCENDQASTIAKYLDRSIDFGRLSQGRESVQHLNGTLIAEQIIGVYDKANSAMVRNKS
jgi:teichuronic acid biosynthesis glycosyltransferase TuaC